MALNLELVGREYAPYRYEVSREKIREYAQALGDTDPRYFSDGDDCVAPPTFAAAYTIVKGGAPVLSDPELGGHTTLLHGSQTYDFGERPARPGDRIVCTPRIAEIHHKGANEYLTVEVDCRFEDTDERAVLSRAVIVFLGSAPAADAGGDGSAPAADAGGDVDAREGAA